MSNFWHFFKVQLYLQSNAFDIYKSFLLRNYVCLLNSQSLVNFWLLISS